MSMTLCVSCAARCPLHDPLMNLSLVCVCVLLCVLLCVCVCVYTRHVSTSSRVCQVQEYVRRKLQRSVSECTNQEDFSQLASLKILVCASVCVVPCCLPCGMARGNAH